MALWSGSCVNLEATFAADRIAMRAVERCDAVVSCVDAVEL
jgi:hypothetical protein